MIQNGSFMKSCFVSGVFSQTMSRCPCRHTDGRFSRPLVAGFRTTIYRCAEAMTVFAVMTAGLFPIIHIGRPWKFFWLIPYPNWRLLWPNFKSPLVWDVFAISTYLTISVTFLFIGLLPDFATLRDAEKNPMKKRILGLLSFGWRNSENEWRHFARAYLFLAAFSTPLVLSVHSVVSFDFATSVIPGWHTTIFPPYFVAGAIYSGFAMVLTLMIPLRAAYGMQDFITMRHIENMAKVMLATGLIVGYGYTLEAFMAWYSGSKYETFMMWNRMTGPYWWSYALLILCNVVTPIFLWSKRIRTSVGALFVISIIVNIGMWLERFLIVVPSLGHKYDTYGWGAYRPGTSEVMITVATFAAMALIAAMLTFLYGLVLCSAATRLSGHFGQRPGLGVWLNRLAGLVMIGFGLRMVWIR